VNKNKKGIAILLCAFGLLLAACGGNDDAAETTTTAASAEMTTTAADRAIAGGDVEAAPEPGDDGALEAADADTLGTGGVEGNVLQTATLGRDIIFTADMTVAVTDVAAAGEEATRIIEGLGGYLFGQETTGAPEPHSVLTFKVLPGDFQRALAALGSVGEVRTQSVSADDVTERVVDLESRISTAETSVERLKGFLEEATDIDAIAELENQLLQRETDLETMRGELRTLQDRVDLATIYLTLTEALSNPNIDLRVTGFPGHDEGVSCPGDGGIAVEEGEEATVCFEVVNTGDTSLASFHLEDTVLEVELGDLIVVWGDPEGILDPGQSLVLAYEITVDKNLRRTQTRVSAEPVDQEGNRVEGREIASTVSMTINAIDPGGLPGFRDGLEASWNALVWIGGVIVLFAGVILPFVIPLALLGALWIWLSRRRPEQEQAAASAAPPWETNPEPTEPEPTEK
jgi:hypothetical protein